MYNNQTFYEQNGKVTRTPLVLSLFVFYGEGTLYDRYVDTLYLCMYVQRLTDCERHEYSRAIFSEETGFLRAVFVKAI